ncbi:UDP-N-acetylmuramoyl-tripeptide--D-alanyl-D-alanine ligase [Alicyclobacillus sp.]|uniref:UDP-N-acetylmuramoyl-tripeptide--D-alanyl-D- alanine ligase n=1 Tax=Alicyclobacillus sp. TaxID=61169 RepID=UPI0025C5D4FD|nr:UDP-N-acetylmuramoyl-tripeptide--D-alanyl-D-alanine ligase [Alicyclobacillus sp.]MCL6515813.1 UDP-N-acetylmuramoyl-tripeptide--D-alanyl-D-alanine ligase [Alicyclobacillus sp.]
MHGVIWIAVLCGWLSLAFRTAPLMYYAQRESYQVQGYIRHHLRRTVRMPDLLLWAIAVIDLVAVVLGATLIVWLMSAATLGVALRDWAAWRRGRPNMKVPLVWTARAKRLAVAHLAVGAIEAVVVALWLPALAGVPAALAVVNALLALLLTRPVESGVQARYKRRANQRIRRLKQLNQLRVVGITGSYGKTSTKFILAAILGAKYDVLATPGSYNTPMGICKVVNSDLEAHHQVFIAEMGARHKGDIRELVRLAEPDYSIITAVGPAHLETFGSLEAIAHTKFDLARGTSPDGVCVVNGDNAHCREEAKTLERPPLFYGLRQADHLSAYARDITVGERGTVFTLVLPGDGEVECQTRLLGQHNVLNIVGAALLARRMGLTLEEIARGIERIEPVEHRLQLIDPGTGILVIDDAFNSNPEGAAAALEVLSQFEGRRKWIVTPGMVELGAESEMVHREFGRRMAAVCDRVVLVGRLNQSAMLAGLREAGFPEDRVMLAASLAEAQAKHLNQLAPGDVVLFENDLPDHLERA